VKKKSSRRILIVGCGDVVRRILPQLLQRWQVIALVRTRDPQLAALGVCQIKGDLDQPATLRRLAGVANAVIHSAPPSAAGVSDRRTKHLLGVLRRGKSLPRRLVYISTSGVYGDCHGEQVRESHALATKSARAIRRIDAETQLRAFACGVSILRAPGIYAADRLPLERLRQNLPLFLPQQDNYTNHIHAADLGRACLAALHRGRPNRTYNISDDSRLLMGEWFDLLADSFALPRAPRLPREVVQQSVSPLQWSFMSESRQLDNTRMKRELGLRLHYPTVMTCLEKKETPCSG
jgi:nucleoside-diphosphate-sugar epimerase